MNVDEVRHLYCNGGLSAREVGERVGKKAWQVIKFMKKHNIPRRTAAETQRLQFQRRPLSFKKKRNMTVSDVRLYEIGLMLYWAEGVKSDRKTVDFANSDKRMIMLFLKMLREIYQVDESRIRVLLYCYSDQDPLSLVEYWSKLLSIPEEQFYKPYVRHVYNSNKINRMPHGLVHIRYSDVKLFSQVQEDIDIISEDLVK